MFGMMATPNTHKKFIKKINSFRYDIEGETFKGKQAPFISEIKFYDIRIPEELEDEVIRDLNLGSFSMGTTTCLSFKIVMFIYRMFIKFFTPFRPIKEVKGDPKFSLDKYSWKYIIPIGILKRRKMKTKMCKDREVL